MTKTKRKYKEEKKKKKSKSSAKKRQKTHVIVEFGQHRLPVNLMLWICFQLELADLGRLSQVSKTVARWFLSLETDYRFWWKLSEMHRLEYVDASLCYKPFRSNFEFLYNANLRNPGPLMLHLNMGALQTCPKCGIESEQVNTAGLPISIYEAKERKSKSKSKLKPPVYRCINRKCKHQLKEKLGKIPLHTVFDFCPKIHKHFDEEARCFAEFEADIHLPNSEKVLDDGFSYCRLCGLLRRQVATTSCPSCKRVKCKCEKCICCKSRKCKCVLCAGCDGCKVRKHGNPCTCRQKYCRGCGLEPENCECPSSSEEDSFY